MTNPNILSNLRMRTVATAFAVGALASGSTEMSSSLSQSPNNVAHEVSIPTPASLPACTEITSSMGSEDPRTIFFGVTVTKTATLQDGYRINSVEYEYGDEVPGQARQKGGEQRAHTYHEPGVYEVNATVTLTRDPTKPLTDPGTLDCPPLKLTILPTTDQL